MIFSIFINRIPNTIGDFLPIKEKKLVTFLNPHSYLVAKKNISVYRRFNVIASDGFLPVTLLKIFNCKKNTRRFSFDMTSVAPFIFEYAIKERKKVFFIGSKDIHISNFADIISSKFPDLNFDFRNGYFKNDLDRKRTIESILAENFDIVIIGMGAPVQEKFSINLLDSGYQGSIYTCGGFFHQTTNRLHYYPKIINRFHLRFLYRMYKEPKNLNRVFFSVPKFTLQFIFSIIKSKF